MSRPMDAERIAWRQELREREPAIVAAGRISADWWRDEFIAEFGHDPLEPPRLRLIQGGRS